MTVPNHETIGFVRHDDGSATLWASIRDYADWVVEVRVVPTESGPAIGQLRVCPYQPERYITADGAISISRGRIPIDESGATGDPTWNNKAEDVPPAGAHSRMLHRINLRELIALAQEQAREWGREKAAAAETVDVGDIAAYLAEVAESANRLGSLERRRGRPRDDEYLRWAAMYAEKVASGSAHPIADLAREHLKELGGDFEKARIYVRDTITTARSFPHNLLTKSPGRGKSGGQLTPKALALITEHQAKEN